MADRNRMFNIGPTQPPSRTNRVPVGTARRSIGAILLAAVWLASACGGAAEIAQPTEAERVEALLWAEGEDADVVACVLRVGRRAIDRGPLSPAELDELTAGCRVARARLAGESPEGQERGGTAETEPAGPSSTPTSFGDDPRLDRLWTDCEAGSGAACDELFVRAPVGTDYETFGVTCGQRDDVLHCTDLDRAEGSDEPVPLIYRELQAQLAEESGGAQDAP